MFCVALEIPEFLKRALSRRVVAARTLMPRLGQQRLPRTLLDHVDTIIPHLGIQLFPLLPRSFRRRGDPRIIPFPTSLGRGIPRVKLHFFPLPTRHTRQLRKHDIVQLPIQRIVLDDRERAEQGVAFDGGGRGEL
jgi:hypothetical protein